MIGLDNDMADVDSMDMLTPEQINNFKNNFKELPQDYEWVKDLLVKRILANKMAEFYGTTEDSTAFRVYHGTLETRLESIAQNGMKAFMEFEEKEPRIFVTASPTLAMWHSIENRPHDTLRKQGKVGDLEAQGEPVLLVIQVNKEWLNQNEEAQKPSSKPKWVKEMTGIGPEDDIRTKYFKKSVEEEIIDLESGRECSDFGFVFPVSEIPPEFIYMQERNGGLRPIKEVLASRNA
jgi:hypothetical protein